MLLQSQYLLCVAMLLKYTPAAMVWQIYVLCIIVNCAAFKVSAPSSRLVAIRGQPTVLGCEFTYSPDNNFSDLVVTWQRQEDSRVVHSFYRGKDQLDRQSEDYRNRTALFVSALRKGNASLRMEGVGVKDVGIYLCLVSNMRGTGRIQVHLEYGALYTEPRPNISVSSCGVMVQFETEGFPKPEVQWVGTEGQSLPHHTELWAEAADLYRLKSSYEAHTSNLTVTFTLKNRLLNQDLQSPVNLRYVDDGAKCGVGSTVIFLSVLCCVLLASGMACILLKHCNCRKTPWIAKNGQSVPVTFSSLSQTPLAGTH